jgi:hypothetical protein
MHLSLGHAQQLRSLQTERRTPAPTSNFLARWGSVRSSRNVCVQSTEAHDALGSGDAGGQLQIGTMCAAICAVRLDCPGDLRMPHGRADAPYAARSDDLPRTAAGGAGKADPVWGIAARQPSQAVRPAHAIPFPPLPRSAHARSCGARSAPCPARPDAPALGVPAAGTVRSQGKVGSGVPFAARIHPFLRIRAPFSSRLRRQKRTGRRAPPRRCGAGAQAPPVRPPSSSTRSSATSSITRSASGSAAHKWALRFARNTPNQRAPCTPLAAAQDFCSV